MAGVSQFLGDAFVEIRPEFTKFTGELKSGLNEATTKGAGDATSSFDKMEKVGKAAFLGLAGAAIGVGTALIHAGIEGEQATAGLRNAVKNAGGNFEEFETTLGKVSDRFAKLGLNKEQVENSLSRIIGITKDTAGAERVLSISADVAAARHIDLQSAANLVAKASEGLVTPLRRWGIQIDTSGTKAQVAERALAALQERFGGAAQAQADTYAGKMRAFGAQLHNTEEEIGTALLPTVGRVVGGLGEMVGFFDRNRDAAVALGVVVGGPLVAAMTVYAARQAEAVGAKVVEFFAAMAAEVRVTAAALGEAGLAFDTVLGPIGLVVAAVTLLTVQLNENAAAHQRAAHEQATAFTKGYLDSIAGATNRTELLKQKVLELNQQGYVGGKIDTKANAEAHESLAKSLNDEIHKTEAAKEAAADLAAHSGANSDAAKEAASSFGISSEMADKLAKKLGIDLSAATDEETDKLTKLVDRLKETNPHALAVADALGKLADDTLDAGEKAAGFKTALDLIVGANIPLTSATAAMRESIGKIGDKEELATQKTKAFKTALDTLIGGNVDAERALVTLGDSLDGLADKLKLNANSFDINTKAGRENLSTVEDVVTNVRAHIDALQNQGASQDEIRKAFDADTKSLRAQLTAAGLSNDEIDKMLTKYGLVPSTIDKAVAATKISTNSLDLNTDAGRKNVTMIDDAVTKIRDHIEQLRNQGASADQLKTAFDNDTKSLRDQLTQAGFTKDQIDKLIASYALVPSSINTVIAADTTPAQQAWNDLMKAAQPYLDALSHLSPDQIKGIASTVSVPSFDRGGWVGGPLGAPLPAIVHGGEFVLSRDMVRSLSGILGAPAAASSATAAASGDLGPVVGQLIVHEAANAYKTGVEAAMAIRSLQYRKTGQ